MARVQLEHIIRAAAATANVTDIVVIGSQAILGSVSDPPEELTQSIDADVFPRDFPQRSIVIDGAIGELSMFHETFGYYAHGVDETTAVCRKRGVKGLSKWKPQQPKVWSAGVWNRTISQSASSSPVARRI